MDAEALAEGGLEPGREELHHLVAVARADLAGLFDLDDLPADEPVGLDHRGVDRARDLGPCLLEDLRDPGVELLAGSCAGAGTGGRPVAGRATRGGTSPRSRGRWGRCGASGDGASTIASTRLLPGACLGCHQEFSLVRR